MDFTGDKDDGNDPGNAPLPANCPLSAILWSYCARNVWTDMKFVCGGGDGVKDDDDDDDDGLGSVVECHRAVLAQRCGQWAKMLETHADDESVTVLVPDVSRSDLIRDLFLLYNNPSEAGMIADLAGKVGEDAKDKEKKKRKRKRNYPQQECDADLSAVKEDYSDGDNYLSEVADLGILNSSSRSDNLRRSSRKRRKKTKYEVSGGVIQEFFCLTNCGQAFASVKELDLHCLESGHEKPIVASSPSSSPVLLRCLACSKTYRTTVALDDHWATAHNNADHNGSSSKCDVCGKEFAKKKEFYAHKLIHRPDKWNFKCSDCDERFMTNRLLRTHLSKTHGRAISCAICGKAYSNDSNLRAHLTNIHGEAEFFCEVCGRAFKSKHYLSMHIKEREGCWQ